MNNKILIEKISILISMNKVCNTKYIIIIIYLYISYYFFIQNVLILWFFALKFC